MRIKLRVWNCDQKASDGSVIPLNVFEEYFASKAYLEAIENRSMLCSLTHRSRSIKSATPDYQNLKSTVGADDMLLVVDHNTPSPVMYINAIYYDRNTGWISAEATLFDESTADEDMAKQIKRLKSLLRAGCKVGCSLVIIGAWMADKSMGGDYCSKIAAIKGADITLNPSQKGARVEEILEDENGGTPEFEEEFYYSEHGFSEKEIKDLKSGTPVMRCFSSPDILEGLPKTSKVGLRFTEIKAKQFSCISEIEEVIDNQKQFSVGSLKERLRMNKLSPRQSFRRLVLDYKQLCKAQGGVEKIDPEDLRVLKSLFTSDVLNILRQIHPDILQGKQISTLLGASSLGKNTRVAAQKLQIPYKLASKEVDKNGFLSKPRFQKLQDSYMEFINAMMDEVFGSKSNVQLPGEESDTESSTQEEEQENKL